MTRGTEGVDGGHKPRGRRIASLVNEPHVAGLGESSEDEEAEECEDVKYNDTPNRF